jgi:hypothetical protein
MRIQIWLYLDQECRSFIPAFLLPAIHDDISVQVTLLLQKLAVAADSGNEISQYFLGLSVGNFSRIGKLGHILFTAEIELILAIGTFTRWWKYGCVLLPYIHHSICRRSQCAIVYPTKGEMFVNLHGGKNAVLGSLQRLEMRSKLLAG